MKELRFHPQYRSLIFTTAEDSFNIFRPNLDPDYEEEAKEGSKMKGADYAVDSEEDQEEEDRRMIRTAKELNK
jgi:hypothetical protein